MISLDLTKSSEVRIAGDRPIYEQHSVLKVSIIESQLKIFYANKPLL